MCTRLFKRKKTYNLNNISVPTENGTGRSKSKVQHTFFPPNKDPQREDTPRNPPEIQNGLVELPETREIHQEQEKPPQVEVVEEVQTPTVDRVVEVQKVPIQVHKIQEIQNIPAVYAVEEVQKPIEVRRVEEIPEIQVVEEVQKPSVVPDSVEVQTVPGISVNDNSLDQISVETDQSVSRRSSTDTVELNIDSGAERRPGVIPSSTHDENNMDAEEITKHPKAPEDDQIIREAIEKNDFIKRILKGKILKEVVDAMYNREIKAKEVIIKEGDQGSHMYVSVKGRFEVSIKGKGIVTTFEDVRVFGELAILYNAKRNATIKAVKPGRVWVLDRSIFQRLMVRSNIQEQDEMVDFLQHVPKLNKVGRQALQKVATLLKPEYFSPGTAIVTQGDKGNKFYIIRVGTVTISKQGEGVVGHFSKGQYFGELALLAEDVRQATVTADASGVECLTLQRQEFIQHFGELKEDGILTVPKEAVLKTSITATEHQDVELNDLKIVTTLGVGGFGRVELVQHKTRNLIFALKYLKKIDMVEQNQQEHVYNERNIQMGCRSKFIVRLYKSYRDAKYIYFLMEPCLGGDLWTLLQRQKNRRFEEKDSRFIAACVLEAFSYLHDRGIVYRDLKPENLLIDEHGYIKLTDFGFAKNLNSRGRTFTFAGTPEYVAPEIILSKGHDKAVDYWAFGIFIFELLTGRTPFRTNDASHMRTYNKILMGIDSVDFPSYVPPKARHIIEKLCKHISTERLGCQKKGIKDIKEHRWFVGFDWTKLNEGKMTAPFKPKLKSNIDTRYFESFKKDSDVPPDEISGWDEKL